MSVQRTILFFLILHAVAAKRNPPSACGKLTRKLKYLQETRLTSPNPPTAACRYKIRVPGGMHVRVTFSELRGGPGSFKLFDASKTPFRWQKSSELALPSDVSLGAKAVYPTSLLAIKYISGGGRASFAVNLAPVLPEDGDCGFDVKVIPKKRPLRSPGFPRTRSPSGLRCNWNLQAAQGQQIVFTLNSMKLKGDGDYLEVYEGDSRLAHHTGNLRSPVTYKAVGNALRVYYHTTTGTSKGFKAKYSAVKSVNVTEVVEPLPPVSGPGVKCYTRTSIIMSNSGVNLMNQQSETRCSAAESCGLFLMSGTSDSFGGSIVDVQVGVCVPSSTCQSDPCASMPPSSDIKVTSCQATCCNNDLCNASPGPSVMPPTAGGSSGTTCYDILSSEGMDITFINSKSVKACPADSKCARITTTATSSDLPGNVEITTVYGSCLPKLACEFLDCSSIPKTMPNLVIKSCTAACCDGDLCNGGDDDPKIPPTPELPPPDIQGVDDSAPVPEGEYPLPPIQGGKSGHPSSGDSIQCYVSMVIESGAQKMVNEESVMPCPGQICMVLKANALMVAAGTTIKAKMTYGLCMAKASCDPGFCTQLNSIAGIPPGTSFDGCRVTCCDTPLCNKQ